MTDETEQKPAPDGAGPREPHGRRRVPPPSNPYRRPDDGRKAASRRREAAIAALLPSPWPGQPAAEPTAAQRRLAESILDLDLLILAMRARVQERGAVGRTGELKPAAARLVSLIERRASLLAELAERR